MTHEEGLLYPLSSYLTPRKAQRLACWITYNNCLVGFLCLDMVESYFTVTACILRAPSN